MPTVNVYSSSGDEVGKLELSDVVFGAEVKEHLLHQVVRYQLAARRAGTHKAKERSEVSGGGKKPFRQKGTGRARAGTTRSPIWRGGGVVHGPRPRSYAFKVNKKERTAALRSAISRRTEEGALVVLDGLAFDAPKTRDMADFVKRFELKGALVVLPEKDRNVLLSARNLPGVCVLPAEGLNVYDILRHPSLVMTSDAVKAVTERLEA